MSAFAFFLGSAVRHEVGTRVRHYIFTVAILAQGTNRGDALCAALLLNRVVSNPHDVIFAILHASGPGPLDYFSSFIHRQM